MNGDVPAPAIAIAVAAVLVYVVAFVFALGAVPFLTGIGVQVAMRNRHVPISAWWIGIVIFCAVLAVPGLFGARSIPDVFSHLSGAALGVMLIGSFFEAGVRTVIAYRKARASADPDAAHCGDA